MSTKLSRQRLALITVALVAVLALALCGSTVCVITLPSRLGEQETVVLGQTRLIPGAPAALRVLVRDVRDASPVAGAVVRVALRPAKGRPITLYEGTTDSHGTTSVQFTVPADAPEESTLVIETASSLGRDRVEKQVTVRRSYKVLLTTDKPLYQPGQVIHMRALALAAHDLRPASEETIEFVVADPKGNKVFRQKVTTSPHGIAAADFQLADQVNTGPYKVTATLGDTSSERTVTVEHYVLPKFKVEVSTDRTYYLPGERVSGELSARYFFGKPVQGGRVRLVGYAFDYELHEVLSLEGETDEEGRFAFDFELPPYFVGGLEQGQTAQFFLEATVTDQADHSETTNITLPVAQERIVIDAVPESGQLKPDIENILYVVTAYPDGSPAECELTVQLARQGTTLTARTGPYGLAEVRFVPQQPWEEFTITARDSFGNAATTRITAQGQWSREYVLLRPERPTYRVGETLHADVFTSQPVGTVYLDVIRQGQTVSTRAVDVQDGHAAVDIDLTADLYGTLELHAYKILSHGEIVRDTRLVVVDLPQGLALTATPDAAEYRPGDTATVSFAVRDEADNPTPAALGISVVDESVFALQEMDPGFLKLYFLLEKELQKPRYQIKRFTWPQVLQPEAVEPALREAQMRAAQATLARAEAGPTAVGGPAEVSPFTLQVNSRDEKIQRIHTRAQNYFRGLSRVLAPLVFLIPPLMGLVAVVALWRERVLGRSLALGLFLLLIPAVLLLLLPTPPWYGNSPLDKLGYVVEWLMERAMAAGLALGMMVILGLIGFIALAIHAWREREAGLGVNLALLMLYVVGLPLLLLALMVSGREPDEKWVIAYLLGYLLVPGVLILQGAGYAFRRRGVPFMAALAVAGFALLWGVLAIGLGPVVDRAFSGITSSFRGEELGVRQLGGPPMPVPGIPVEVTKVVEVAKEVVVTPMPVPADMGKPETAAQAPEPRLRQFFPETLFWLPEAVTDEQGHLDVTIPLADSITTWRLSAIASSQDGRLGATEVGLRVFQDFFVDIDLPVALTQGDMVKMPVAVHNYLPQGQTVRLILEPDDWFEFAGPAEQELYIAANDVEAVYFPIRITATSGRYRPRVKAIGERMSDYTTSTHDVIIHPNGQRFQDSVSDRLRDRVEQTIPIPAEAIPGTARITVKIYPGILSQVVEGLEKILRLPFG